MTKERSQSLRINKCKQALFLLSEYQRIEWNKLNQVHSRMLTNLRSLLDKGHINSSAYQSLMTLLTDAHEITMHKIRDKHRKDIESIKRSYTPMDKMHLLTEQDFTSDKPLRADDKSLALERLKKHHAEQLDKLHEKHHDYEISLEYAMFQMRKSSHLDDQKRKSAIQLFNQRMSVFQIEKEREIDALHYKHYEQLRTFQKSLNPFFRI